MKARGMIRRLGYFLGRGPVVAALLGAALLAACGGRTRPSGEKPSLAGGSVVEVSSALLRAEATDTIDMGLLRSGEVVSRQLKVRNADTVPFVITGVRTVCGCTVVDYTSEPVRPGEEALVTVGLDTNGIRGWVCKFVGLNTTLAPQNRRLVVTADVR